MNSSAKESSDRHEKKHFIQFQTLFNQRIRPSERSFSQVQSDLEDFSLNE